jgi:DNA-binding protein H-NS
MLLMAKITGIEKASYRELVEARDAIDEALAKRKDEERSEVKRRIAELANESGFEIAELFGGRRGGKRIASGAKYRNPKDTSQTWTGRGRKPNWLVEAVSQGAKLESFEV